MRLSVSFTEVCRHVPGLESRTMFAAIMLCFLAGAVGLLTINDGMAVR